jgi:hypothetical protein
MTGLTHACNVTPIGRATRPVRGEATQLRGEAMQQVGGKQSDAEPD